MTTVRGSGCTKPVLALYASPECCRDPNLRLYKGYFNVAWFVRAYAELLFRDYHVVTTAETALAVDAHPHVDEDGAHPRVDEDDAHPRVDEDLVKLGLDGEAFQIRWGVPGILGAGDIETRDFGDGCLDSRDGREDGSILYSLGAGFDAQVKLAAMVATGQVERFLMFQDPDDVQTHLPEAWALIRNCTIANVPLNINAGATFWAEAAYREKARDGDLAGFGLWRTDPRCTATFAARLNPRRQVIAFIAHETEKPKMARLAYHYRATLLDGDYTLTGTSGTCRHVNEHLLDRASPWEIPTLHAASTAGGAGHGPTGGDVVIADQIIDRWRTDPEAAGRLEEERAAYKAKPLVRDHPLSHTIIFFIDHAHAQPHEADIHVLLRTCLHPSHGVHILLNDRTAREWADTLRDGVLQGRKGKEEEGT